MIKGAEFWNHVKKRKLLQYSSLSTTEIVKLEDQPKNKNKFISKTYPLIDQDSKEELIDTYNFICKMDFHPIFPVYCISFDPFSVITQYSYQTSLQDIFNSREKLNPTEKCIIIFGIAAGLHYLHSNNIFHLHLHASNVLLDTKRQPKLVDYGFWKFQTNDMASELIRRRSFYLPPEYIDGKFDEQSDVYEYGIMIYQLLTYENPILDEKNEWRIFSTKYTKNKLQFPPSFPKFYEKLISACLDFNPTERPKIEMIISSFLYGNDPLLPGTDSTSVKKYSTYILKKYNYKFSKEVFDFVEPPLHPKCEYNIDFYVQLGIKNKIPEAESYIKYARNRINSNGTLSKEEEIELKLLKKLADLEDPVAMFNYARFTPNSEEAREYMRKSSEEGFPDAQFAYATQFLDPKGSLTIKLLTKAANRDHIEAQIQLSKKYSKGIGVDKDEELASRYMMMAAAAGSPDACYAIAKRLKFGKGIRKDFPKYMKFLKLAAEKGNDKAQIMLGEQIIEEGNIKEGMRYFKMAADRDNPEGMTNYANCLLNIKNHSHEREVEAFQYLKKAAKHGHPQAQCLIATLYLNGIGTKVNIPEAVKNLKMAINSGETQAMLAYGHYLMNGSDIEPANHVEAAKNFQKGADKGDPECQFYYAFCLEKGIGVRRSIRKAKEYLKKAKEQGHPEAAKKLAQL